MMKRVASGRLGSCVKPTMHSKSEAVFVNNILSDDAGRPGTIDVDVYPIMVLSRADDVYSTLLSDSVQSALMPMSAPTDKLVGRSLGCRT